MEIIRKQICLEDSRSRVQGLLPYIPYNIDVSERKNPFIYLTTNNKDGNFGGFPANLYDKLNGVKNYKDILKDYNDIQDMIRHGVKLRHVFRAPGDHIWRPKNLYNDTTYEYTPAPLEKFSVDSAEVYHWIGETSEIPTSRSVLAIPNMTKYEEIVARRGMTLGFSFCEYVEKNLIGRIYVPGEIIGDKVPEFFAYCDIPEWLSWMENNAMTKDCCAKKLWNERGGQKMLDFLKEHRNDYETAISNAMTLVQSTRKAIPYITVPLFLYQTTEDLGTMTDYIEDEETVPVPTKMSPERKTVDDYVAESRLFEFQTGKILTSVDGTPLPGSLQVHSTGPIAGKKTQDMFYEFDGEQWWALSDDDALEVMAGEYNTYDILEEIMSPAAGYRCLIKYGDIDPTGTSRTLKTVMHFPYEPLKPINVHDLGDTVKIGSFISAITETEKTIEFLYVMDGLYTATTTGDVAAYDGQSGTIYREDYPIYKNSGITVDFEIESGDTIYVTGVTVYGDIIDYTARQENVYDEDLGDSVTRKAIESKIEEYTAMAIWNDNDAMETDVFKEDYLMGISDSIVADVNIEINRGSAAAYENHFALSECNTLEDLENYRNNKFNIR